MQRQQNLKRGRRERVCGECMICRIARIPFLITISSVILLQKYYHPLEKAALAAHAHALLRPVPSQTRTRFKEAILMADGRETLLGYNSFAAIVGKIKPVIMECLRRDRLLPVPHLHAHSGLLRHHHAKRTSRPVMALPLPAPNKHQNSESTDQQQHSLGKGRNETASMRRLTRNLSSMVRRFEDQQDFHSSLILQLMNYAQHALEAPTQEVWRRELEDNSISAILRHHHHPITTNSNTNMRLTYGQKLPNSPEPCRKLQVQENYGLQAKAKEQRRKVISPQGLKSMKENMPQRIQTDYDCQVIRKGKKSTSGRKDIVPRKLLGSGSRKKDKLGSLTKSSRVK